MTAYRNLISVLLLLPLTLLVDNKVALAENKSPNLDQRLQRVEQAIEKGNKTSLKLNRDANNLRKELLSLKQRKVTTGAKIRKVERNIYELEERIKELIQDEKQKLNLLKSRKDQIIQVIFALRQLSRIPPISLIGFPASASDLVRTGILLKGTIPQIKSQANKFQKNINSLNNTRKQITLQKRALAFANSKLKKRRIEMSKVFGEKKNIHKKTLEARQVEATRLRRLTREARTLRELFDSLAQQRLQPSNPKKYDNHVNISKNKLSLKLKPRRLDPKNERIQGSLLTAKPISLAKGQLLFPVVGKVINQFGGPNGPNTRAKGILVLANKGAQVISPYNGKIVFAGKFKGYGRLLIVEHGEGYHSLLAGLSYIQCSVGQHVLSGEPIGMMSNGPSDRPELYIEFRQHGLPINPSAWLTTDKWKNIG